MGRALTQSQREALLTLAPLVAHDFYLAGGVAVAYELDHRTSRDLDLFATERDPTELEEQAAQIAGVRVTSRAPGTLHLEVRGVPVTLLRHRFPLLAELIAPPDLPVRIAAPEDLICMKLSAVGGRGARRDFWDLHELLVATGTSLAVALDLFVRKYPSTDPGHVVRALAYFADADAEPMPLELGAPRWESIKRDFLEWVRDLG